MYEFCCSNYFMDMYTVDVIKENIKYSLQTQIILLYFIHYFVDTIQKAYDFSTELVYKISYLLGKEPKYR